MLKKEGNAERTSNTSVLTVRGISRSLQEFVEFWNFFLDRDLSNEQIDRLNRTSERLNETWKSDYRVLPEYYL